jgi:hypothetical protein
VLSLKSAEPITSEPGSPPAGADDEPPADDAELAGALDDVPVDDPGALLAADEPAELAGAELPVPALLPLLLLLPQAAVSTAVEAAATASMILLFMVLLERQAIVATMSNE